MNRWTADTPLKRWAIVLVLLAGGFWLRWQGLGTFPRAYQTDDEFGFLWAGLSLTEGQRPISWSMLPAYARENAILGEIHHGPHHIPIVQPALDHPPLFCLLAGATARLMGARPADFQADGGGTVRLWDVPLARARVLPLILFCATFLLLYDLAARTMGFGPACLALLFYGCISHIVAHNRLVVMENMTTPLLLLNLCVLVRYVEGAASEASLAIVTVVAVAVALMCKVVAAAQAGVIVGMLLLADRRREVLYPVLGVALGVALYCLYGWWGGWGIFRAVLQDQAARFYGFNLLEKLAASPTVVHDPDLNYLLLLGWIGVVAMLFAERPVRVLAAPLLYLLGYVFFAAIPAVYGWHILPFYPFLCMGLAGLVARAGQPKAPLAYLAILALLLPYAFHVVFVNHVDWARPMRFAYLLTVAGLAFLYFFAPRFREQTVRYSLIALVAAALLREIFVVLVEWTA